MEDKEILAKLISAIHEFTQDDGELLNLDANERSISHKLAEHLQRHFSDLKVDCEYNRHGNDVKRLQYPHTYPKGPIKWDDLDAKTVFPDIVIHKRGTDECNRLVIEIKKSNSAPDFRIDEEKLQAFTKDQYNYQLGILLLADVKEKKINVLHIYKQGEEVTSHYREFLREFGYVR